MHGVTHYCVPNMPAVVARTATMAMTNALMPYIQQVCDGGIVHALQQNPGLGKGVCTYQGICTNEVIARIFEFKSQPIGVLVKNPAV
jgi:alanine dehydrogenase